MVGIRGTFRCQQVSYVVPVVKSAGSVWFSGAACCGILLIEHD